MQSLRGTVLTGKENFPLSPHLCIWKTCPLKKNATVNHIFFSSLMQLYLCQLPIFIRKDWRLNLWVNESLKPASKKSKNVFKCSACRWGQTKSKEHADFGKLAFSLRGMLENRFSCCVKIINTKLLAFWKPPRIWGFYLFWLKFEIWNRKAIHPSIHRGFMATAAEAETLRPPSPHAPGGNRGVPQTPWDIISPVCPGSSQGSSPVGTCLKKVT